MTLTGISMRTYDGLIFDLDGTLWNSTAPVSRAWNEVAAASGGKPISQEAIQGIMGLPHGEVFQRIFPDVSQDERTRLEEACTRREMEMLRQDGGELYPGVADGLATLARKFPLFVVSNCDSDYLDIFFQRTGLRGLFRDAECYGNTGLSKALNLQQVRERNHLRNPCYTGDTAGDQVAAHKAGIDYYHVTYGFGQPERECLTFGSFAEVCAFFCQIDETPQPPGR